MSLELPHGFGDSARVVPGLSSLAARSRPRRDPPAEKEKKDKKKEQNKLAWRRTQPYAAVSTAVVSLVFDGAPYGATKRVRGVPK